MAKGIEVKFNDTEAKHLLSPVGPIGRMVAAIAEETAVIAKSLCLDVTGNMRSHIRAVIVNTADGYGYRVVSDAVDPKTGVPYAIFHESKNHPVDKTPHRSLIPALERVVARYASLKGV